MLLSPQSGNALPYLTGGSRMLLAEPKGFAFDATVLAGSVTVRDTTTTANNIRNIPFNSFSFDDTSRGAISGSSLAQASASMKFVSLSDGTLRSVPHNLFIQSSSLTNGAWSPLNCTLTGGATAPDGTATAFSWVENSATGGHEFKATSLPTSMAVGLTYNWSIYAKPLGAGSTRYLLFNGMSLGGNTECPTFDVTNGTVSVPGTTTRFKSATITAEGGGWYRCSAVVVATSVAGQPEFDLSNISPNAAGSGYTGDSTSGLIVWGPQITQGAYLHPYHSTTASQWFGVPQGYDSVNSQYGILGEPAATNLTLSTDDLTNASWTKSNTTAVWTDVSGGPDGGPFSRLTASAGNGTCLQAITSGSSARNTSVWLRRRTGSGNIDLTQDNGSTWTTQSITSSWARYSLSAVTSTNPTVGIRIVTNGDVVDVCGFQHETGSIVTSTIQTGSATVTRAADQISVATSTFPWSDTNGTIYADFMTKDVASGLKYVWEAYVDTNNRISLYGTTADPTMSNRTASTQDVATDLGTLVANTRTQITVGWVANDFDGSQDGAAISTDSVNTLTTGYTTLYLGKKGSATTEELHGFIYRLVYVPRQIQVSTGRLATWRYNF